MDVFIDKSNNQIIKTTNKETDSDSSYSSYDDTAEMLFGNENKQDNKQIETSNNTQIPKLLSEEITKLKQYIKEILNLVCKYKGVGNAYNEIMNYIPYNEQSIILF